MQYTSTYSSDTRGTLLCKRCFFSLIFKETSKRIFNMRSFTLLSFLGAVVGVRVPPPVMQAEPRGANPVLGVASMGMGLLKPVFKAETAVQAAVTNLGSYDTDEIRAEIEEIRETEADAKLPLAGKVSSGNYEMIKNALGGGLIEGVQIVDSKGVATMLYRAPRPTAE